MITFIRRAFMPVCPFLSIAPLYRVSALGLQCLSNEQKPTIANKSLAANKVFGYSVAVAANSATGCSSPKIQAHSAAFSGFFVPALWRAVHGGGRATGILYPGLLTRARFATHSVVVMLANSKVSTGVPPMKTLSLPIAAKIKRNRIAAHKAMAAAALRADSSLNVRLARYNSHMSKARAIAGGSL